MWLPDFFIGGCRHRIGDFERNRRQAIADGCQDGFVNAFFQTCTRCERDIRLAANRQVLLTVIADSVNTAALSPVSVSVSKPVSTLPVLRIRALKSPACISSMRLTGVEAWGVATITPETAPAVSVTAMLTFAPAVTAPMDVPTLTAALAGTAVPLASTR